MNFCVLGNWQKSGQQTAASNDRVRNNGKCKAITGQVNLILKDRQRKREGAEERRLESSRKNRMLVAIKRKVAHLTGKLSPKY